MNLSRFDFKQARLIILAGLFLTVFAVILTLSPAARERSWDVDYRWDHWIALLAWLVVMAIAHIRTSRLLPDRDPYLLPIAGLLSGWGILTIWRLAPAFGYRQVLWLAFSLAVFVLGLRLPGDLSILRRYKYIWLSGGLLLTALTLIFGTNPGGPGLPRLWLSCCGLYLQPSEPLKLLLIAYLASYFGSLPLVKTLPRQQVADSGTASQDKSSPHIRVIFPWLIPTLFMIGLTMLLLVAQRDLGTAAIFLFLYISVVYVATNNRWIVVLGIFTMLLAGAVGYVLFDVVRLRMDAWFNPWLDPSGRSYQIVQSLLAISSGGVFGRGPGMGNPGLVPIPHSDFIFATIAEETGLIGVIGLICLLLILAFRVALIAIKAPDRFQRYLATGILAYLIGQSILIMGGNLRLLPLTGVTLPFVSYGGSSLITAYIALLFLLHISNQSGHTPPARLEPRPVFVLAGLLFSGLALAALVSGWWSFYRGPELVTRTDNARRSISDRYVRRGTIYDSNGQVVMQTNGAPGSYVRKILYADLSPLIGYNSPTYGQSGLEAGMDEYLRGLQGYPGLTIWWNHIQYGQPPAGLDIRITIDLELQKVADEMLADHTGAIVVLNAQTAHIVASVSHPTFDANQIDDIWQSLIKDPGAPLLNRAIQGRYEAIEFLATIFAENESDAVLQMSAIPGLPQSDVVVIANQEALISPLQAAWLAAAISNAGVSPSPYLVSAYKSPYAGWELFPLPGDAVTTLSPTGVDHLLNALSDSESQTWSLSFSNPVGVDYANAWYIGGTLPGWQGSNLVIAVVVEESDEKLAEQIGQTVLLKGMGY